MDMLTFLKALAGRSEATGRSRPAVRVEVKAWGPRPHNSTHWHAAQYLSVTGPSALIT